MNNPVRDLTKIEWSLWLGSLFVVITSNFFSGSFDALTLIATCSGATALIFAAKGNVWAQIFMIVFCALYGIISWRFCYWGEMITYLGMALPMAIWSMITWIKHPSETGKEVKIQILKGKQILYVTLACVFVTILFYFILDVFNTPNLLFSTVSITTSFLAAALMMLRSSYYAIAYALNDVILIILWGLAAIENFVYFPVVVNFVIFFLNDMYGFVSWKKREKN